MNGADYSPDFDSCNEQMLTLAMKQVSLDMYVPDAAVLIKVNQRH